MGSLYFNILTYDKNRCLYILYNLKTKINFIFIVFIKFD